VRDLAEAQGLTVAALYYHFATKLDVLVAIMSRAMDDIIRETEQARDAAAPDPVSQLRAMVRAHVLFHTQRQQESFVGNSELRSLEGEHLDAILARRDHEERMFRDVLERGVAEGVFTTDLPRDCARAILAMCIQVSTWFRPDGSLTPEQVADRYERLTMQLVGATDRAAG
jgi:AcrR family transcriptional regulator